MGRRPCCSKEGMKKGAWTAIEDKILASYIQANGEGQWRNLPKNAGLIRCGKSCRLRWLNYLRPDIKRGNITHDEEDLIIRLHNLLGNRWSLIAGRLPGRTDNEIKNYWNTTLGKKANAQSQNNTSKSASPSPTIKNCTLQKLAGEPSQPTQVIRTRATRCTKVIIPFDNQTSINLPHNSPNYGQQSGSQYIWNREPCQDQLGLVEKYMEEGLSHNESLPSDPEEAHMINGWINSVSGLEDNAILDLDCIASLFESEEWNGLEQF